MKHYSLSHLKQLEAESIHVFREVVAEFERPVMLFSLGKDSICMLRLAQKAFYPGKLPFPLMHIDTGYKFPELYEFRDRIAKEIGAELIVYKHELAGKLPHPVDCQKCVTMLKTQALLDALRKYNFDAAFGGARREEETSRAKERVFSFRDKFGQWDPKNQRPELWNIYNARVNPGESIRVFPLSNWTELDVWLYIYIEKIPVAPLYFAQERDVVIRDGQILSLQPPNVLLPGEQPRRMLTRFRTLGCIACTGAVQSSATTLDEIIAEVMTARVSERATRIIDHHVEVSMEIKKREGYF